MLQTKGNKTMNNKALLIVIAVVLVGIFTILLVQTTEETPEEKIANSISEVSADISSGIKGQ